VLSKPRPRVLCVDDDEDSRVMLVTLLRLALIEAKAVGTAAEALSLVQAEHFDLYVLDGWLPEIDGFELCRRMRALDPHIPILFFSGAAYADDKKKGIEAGADAYLTKPDIYELVGTIKQFTSHVAVGHDVRAIRPWAEALLPVSDTSTSDRVRPQLSSVNLLGVPRVSL
jgi:two-component system, OmpR family, response regulator